MPHDPDYAQDLCNDLHRAVTALVHQRNDLEDSTAGRPLSAGLRATLVTLIDKTRDLADDLVTYVEALDDQPQASPVGNVSIPIVRSAAELDGLMAKRAADGARDVTPG